MKKCVFVVIIIALLAVISWQAVRTERIKEERNKYQSNTETLLKDVSTYKTNESLNAAKVGDLELKLSEYKKYRSADAELIESLQTKNRDLQRVTTTQIETIKELKADVRDSIVYLAGDTVTITLRCFEYSDKWINFDGCITDNIFNGKIVSRDSLLIAETVRYKRFLGFLWKTNKIKDRQLDVISKNPATKILGIELITIEQ